MRLVIAILVSMLALAAPAGAVCVATGMTPNGTTTFIATPNYTGSTRTFTVSYFFNVTFFDGASGNCYVGVAFQGTAPTPRMTGPYGNILNYTTNWYNPTTTADRVFATFNPGGNSINLLLTTSFTVPAGQTGMPNGSYADATLSFILFSSASSMAVVGSIPTTFGATVLFPLVCTLGGSASGGTQTLDFSNGATISTATKTANFASLTCNSRVTMTLTSMSGAARSPATATAAYTNFFDYVASTTIRGRTVTLDTSAAASASGPESASNNITATPTTNAAVSIQVTPILPAKPLVAGSYADVLTLTLTPY
jgi:hypothetical protein